MNLDLQKKQELANKLKSEILHSKQISEKGEEVWGLSTPAGLMRAERRANLLINLSGMNKSQSILEIGCGSGIFTEKIFAVTGAAITAIDISEALLELARKKVPNCVFEKADAHNLQFADSSLDIVYGSAALHHLDVEIALKEFYRVLRPGGRIIFSEPNMVNPQIWLERNVPYLRRKTNTSPTETAFIRSRITKILAHTGFTCVESFPYDFLHPAIPKSLITPFKNLGLLLEIVPLIKEIAGSLMIWGVKE